MVDKSNRYNLKIANPILLETFCSKKKKRFIFPILFASLFCFFLPLSIIPLLLTDEESDGFSGFIVFIIFFWIISYYLFKLYLWNKQGKEIFIIDNRSFSYYSDYGLFRNKVEHRNYSYIGVYFLYNSRLRRTSDAYDAFISKQKKEALIKTNSLIYFQLDDAPHRIVSQREIPILAILELGRRLDIMAYYRSVNEQNSF
ncbi:hypothetical protein [Dysgonomonas sp. BGC7]|uniref:hypothetical protein n=1 Tax=Dysgonomonas sp. BGC7 TaxID=1658008 RepID=UPI000681BAD3|nr:hypothetical protein [Dysgonomonas sp. BGC7]MBD8387719.1 hypothetical protein [Dysgonomonas sp. BGC7]